MRDKIIGIVLLIIIVVMVGVNTLMLDKKITDIHQRISMLEIDEKEAWENAENLLNLFQNEVFYMNLTVSHEDITEIENSFVDMVGFIKVGRTEDAEVAKSRLLRSLEHLRRLSGFNFDSII